MNMEKFTDRSRGFVQSAQSLALRDRHQQFGTEHLLKVLLDDPGGPCGRPDRSHRRQFTCRPGGGRGGAGEATQGGGQRRRQLYLEPALARVFETAEKAAEKSGDSYVTVERLLLALAIPKGTARRARSPGPG